MSAWSNSENMATEQKQTLFTDSTDIQLLLQRLEKQIKDFFRGNISSEEKNNT